MARQKIKLVPAINELFRTGKLKEFKTGLSMFASGEFPPLVAKAVEKLLNINKIYTIGILKDHKLFGAVHFFTMNKTVITDADYIELFIKEAGVIIQNKLMQAEMLRSEKKFRTIFEDAPLGIALVDSLNGRLYELNKKFILKLPVDQSMNLTKSIG
jgi:hypothetical protein